jgi:hypothetical protein
MSCTVSAAWSRPVLSLCYTEHDLYRGVILSDRITSVGMSRSGLLGQRCTIETHYSCKFVGASITHEHALETREPTYVPRAAKPFFIPVVHNPLGAVGHVAASKLPSQKGRARSHGTCGSTRAHLVKEARSRAEGHVAASELILTRRRGPGPRDKWWHWSPPLQGCVIRSYNLRGSTWMYALLLVLT